MKDRRSIDDVSTAELERILRNRRRAEREARLKRFRRSGRAISLPDGQPDPVAARTDDFRSQLAELAPAPARKRKARTLFDWLLLVVEVAAVVGLGYLLYTGANMLRELNTEVAEAIAQPTLTPTPVIRAVVLPSGHTPPTSPGGARPNEAEIPENLRPLVQAMPVIAIPTSSPQQAIRIEVPRLEALREGAPVVQGDGWEQLKKGVAQHIGTADPGQRGNMVFSAHNDIFGELFRDLDQLQPGDEIKVYTAAQVFIYVVTNTRIVAPTEVSVMDPTASPTLTLISCYPYRVDNQRIVVFADLREE
ncbi:MAG: class D sortase [Chloroflexi bacterium]|nr:class D sortase [Chloroflexota bacterium]